MIDMKSFKDAYDLFSCHPYFYKIRSILWLINEIPQLGIIPLYNEAMAQTHLVDGSIQVCLSFLALAQKYPEWKMIDNAFNKPMFLSFLFFFFFLLDIVIHSC